MGQIFNATNNWWGNASGPTNATTSPSGTGDSITDNVLFTPLCVNAECTTPPPVVVPAPISSGGGAASAVFFTLGPDGRLVALSSTPRSVAPTVPSIGEVLGEATFNFNRSLAPGSRGDDVTELQNRLTSEGVYFGPITGYFGSLTAEGVRKFQKKYGISQVGVVGPQTRARLNLGNETAIPGCAFGNKFNTNTGQACPIRASSDQGCAVGNKFNTNTGQACPVQ